MPRSIDWRAGIAALSLCVALLGWFTNWRDNKRTSARQDAAETRERLREQRATAERVWVTIEGPHVLSVDRLNFQVNIYNGSDRPIYDCAVESFSKRSEAVGLADESDPLRRVRDHAGHEIEASDLRRSLVPPLSETNEHAVIEFQLRGTFDSAWEGLKSPQARVVHSYVQVSFNDGSHCWLIDSKGAPPKLFRDNNHG